MSRMDERIIVSPRSEVFGDETHAFQGLLPLDDPSAEAVIRGLCASPRLVRRGDVEEDRSLKQPIPYVVLVRRGSSGLELFAYTRLSGGGEARLHGKLSVGAGGHMNHAFDLASIHRVVREEAARELAEELSFRSPSGGEVDPPQAGLIALINDDSGPVQQVHIGLLAQVEVPPSVTVTVRETDRLEGHWEPLARLRGPDLFARLEEWSRHALDAFSDPLP
jgi:predicted NUDIX family phosphoesterase